MPFFISMSSDSIPLSERKKGCGRLWRQVDAETKEKFKDPDYLATLPNPFGRDEMTGEPATTRAKKNKTRKFRDAETERWTSKVILDVSPNHLITCALHS